MDGVSLTTVVSRFPLKRVCDFWLCYRKRPPLSPMPTPPLSSSTPPFDALRPMRTPPGLLNAVKFIQDIHDSTTLKSEVSTLCRTLPQADIRSMLPPHTFCLSSPVKPITCGGMSRIYEARMLEFGDVIVKITDRRRSLGKYESYGYTLLQKAGLPIPILHYKVSQNGFDIMAMERLTCTLTTLLTAIAHNQRDFGDLLTHIITWIDALLRKLQDFDLAFCDLSADNIMCRITEGKHIEFVLIDPQFAVSMSHLSAKMGAEWAESVDRIHFGLKMRALSLMKQKDGASPCLQRIAERICKELIGYLPPAGDVRQWLTGKLPSILRIAYSLLGHSASAP